MKYYPLVNEVVPVITLVSKDYGKKRTSITNYYIPPINLWNHPHHNSLPALQNYLEEGTGYFTNEDYEDAGLLRRPSEDDPSLDIPLGVYFNEKINIKPLLPYEGDYIIEGRFGNSIRFGATARSESIPVSQSNNWSTGTKGEVGDPITIIRNGQSVNLDNQGWVHTLENINTDPSSIYLTSNQKIDNIAIAAPDCWYSFGLNAVIPQNDNEEAKKFLDSPVDFMIAEEVEVEESTPPPVENPPEETQPEVITEEEAGFIEEEDTNEYYQQDEGQELEIIERPPLPDGYRLATGENNCQNCHFHKNNMCSKWVHPDGSHAKVRANHENPWVCNAWKKIE